MTVRPLATIRRFQLLQLSVEGVGPFSDPFTLDFTDGADTPCNVFLLASPNGFGKTSLLRILAMLVGLLGGKQERAGDREPGLQVEDIASGRGRAQLDTRVEIEIDGARRAILLTLFAGGLPPAKADSDLEAINADLWVPIGDRPFRGIGDQERETGDILKRSVRAYFEQFPDQLFDDGIPMPTVIFFPADRCIQRPPRQDRRTIAQPDDIQYRPVHVFDADGLTWENSLDNLLVWYSWLDDGRYQQLQDLVAEFIFREQGKALEPVERMTMEARISVVGGGRHRLDQLSHGERALMQLFVRVATHATAHTIVLLDEMDLHLHPIWRIRLMRSLKQLARRYVGLTVIVTTHLPELIEEFAYDEPEEGLIKAGHIISKDEL